MKLNRAVITSLVSLFALAPALAWAHPDHGGGGGFLPGFLHPFLGLDHLLAMLAVGAWAVQLGGRALWALPLAFVAAMAAGGAVGFHGVSMPMTEASIAASVLILGLVITLGARLPVAPALALVIAFAPFHGAAHAAEAPAMASFAAYAAGFLLATGLLHAGGILGAGAARARPALLRLAAAPVTIAGAWMLAARLG